LFLRDGRSDVFDEVGDEDGFERGGLDVNLSSTSAKVVRKGRKRRRKRGRRKGKTENATHMNETEIRIMLERSPSRSGEARSLFLAVIQRRKTGVSEVSKRSKGGGETRRELTVLRIDPEHETSDIRPFSTSVLWMMGSERSARKL